MRLAAPVLAALCAALLLAAPAQARSVPRGWLGVQADGPLTEPGNPFASEWGLMAASGAENVRVAFDWRAAQPVAGGPIDFSGMDAAVVAAAQQRLPVLPVVHRTPAWAATRPADGGASPPRGTAAYTALPDGAGGPLRAERVAVDRPSRRCRGCRSAPGRSGTSRTSRATGARSRSRSPTCGCCAPRAAPCARPTRARARSSPGCRTRAGSRCARSTRRAGAGRSTSSRCTPTPAGRATWSS